jgi:hypothetical protein
VDVAVWVCDTTIASLEPPVAATLYVEPAPITNLFLRSGVLLEPLHRYQPEGIALAAPDQIIIPPLGIDNETAAATNAVVAICVVLVPAEAVGAAGVPVNVGLLLSDLDDIADAMAVNSVSISVPLTTLAGSPVVRPSLIAKLVAFV